MGRTVKAYMLKLFPKLKTNKSLKLLLVILKPNNSILMTLEMAGWHKQAEMAYFHYAPSS